MMSRLPSIICLHLRTLDHYYIVGINETHITYFVNFTSLTKLLLFCYCSFSKSFTIIILVVLTKTDIIHVHITLVYITGINS